MKILRIEVDGIRLFAKGIRIDLVPKGKISESQKKKMSGLYENFYVFNIMSLIGLNATGKTTILKVISAAANILNAVPLNQTRLKDLDSCMEDSVRFRIWYFSAGQVGFLESEIVRNRQNDWIFGSETLRLKPVSGIHLKKNFYDFSKPASVTERKKEELYLPDNISIMIAQKKSLEQNYIIYDLLDSTNENHIEQTGEFPKELLQFLDPGIESFRIRKTGKGPEAELKFFRSPETILLNDIHQVDTYLSSGTIKGINLFLKACHILKNGGCLIIDELENHFNKEIVTALFDFFQDSEINTGGGQMFFSTHYAELLDDFDRNDNIFILRREEGALTIKPLSEKIARTDIKRSEAYRSGFLEGTAPSYKAYHLLKESIKQPGDSV